MANVLEDLVEEVKCMACQKPMQDPKILKCCHMFCKNCLVQNAQLKEAGKTFDCFVCKTRIDLPQLSDFNSLKSSTFHSRILQVLPLTSTESVAELKCSCKKRRTPVLYCYDCARSLCEKCLRAHDDFTSGHYGIRLSDITEENLLSLVHTQSKCTKPNHGKEYLTFYCKCCDICVCQICILEEHQGHELVDVQPLASVERLRIIETLETLREKEEEEKTNLEATKEMTEKITANAEDAKTKVCQVAEELIEIINESKVDLLKQIEDRIQFIMDRKGKQECFLEQTHRSLRLSNLLIEHASHSEILSSKAEIESRCHELINTKSCSTRVDPRVMFIPSEGPSTLRAHGLGSIGSIHTAEQPNRNGNTQEGQPGSPALSVKTDPSSCMAKIEVDLEASRKAKLSVLLRTSKGKPSKSRGDSVEVNISPEENVKFFKVSERLVDKHEVEFYPAVPGRYKAVIKINGKHAYNSPLDLMVKQQDLKMTGEFVMKGVAETFSPWGIAVNSNNSKVAISDIHGNCIAIFDLEGKLERQIGGRGRGLGQLDQPNGLVFVDNERFAVAERGNHRVQIFSSETGESITTFGSPGHGTGELYSPCGLHANTQNTLFVCDYGNRRVQLFSRDVTSESDEYKCLLIIESPDNMSPFCAITSKEMLLVTENNNPNLRIFSQPEYSTAHSLALNVFEDDGECKPSQPLSLGLDRLGNIIVCDQNNHCIQKMTMTGEKVGVTSKKIDPMYLAVLEDGRLLVTDYTAARVCFVE